jgi:hypothetical protein
MRFTAAEQRAKLATLMKIEGYDSIEDLARWRREVGWNLL